MRLILILLLSLTLTACGENNKTLEDIVPRDLVELLKACSQDNISAELAAQCIEYNNEE